MILNWLHICFCLAALFLTGKLTLNVPELLNSASLNYFFHFQKNRDDKQLYFFFKNDKIELKHLLKFYVHIEYYEQCQNNHKIVPLTWEYPGLPWWLSGKEFACQPRRLGFDPWSGKIPHASELLSPNAALYSLPTLEPELHIRRSRCPTTRERPPLTKTREESKKHRRPNTAKNKSLKFFFKCQFLFWVHLCTWHTTRATQNLA